MHTCIIFAEDYSDAYKEAYGIFQNNGYNAAIDYLAQWDYGRESEYDIAESIESNFLENMYKRNENGEEYILVEHPSYMALYRKI